MYSKLSYTQANFIIWYCQLIWTIYKIKCSKNIQEIKTQANFRVWEIWKSLLRLSKRNYDYSFHSFLPWCLTHGVVCSKPVRPWQQALIRVWLLWKLVISRLSFGTHFLFDVQGLLVYNVIFIVGPNRLGPERLGPKRLGAGSTCTYQTIPISVGSLTITNIPKYTLKFRLSKVWYI